MQEMFTRIDFNAVLKSSFPHRHPDPVEMTNSFVELIEEVPIDVLELSKKVQFENTLI
jgi:hypothetical protein